MHWVFSAVFALNVFLAARALWRVDHPFATAWRPHLPTRALAAVPRRSEAARGERRGRVVVIRGILAELVDVSA